jgi:photosystem II stability/assembly factor-like uncharacterized protein
MAADESGGPEEWAEPARLVERSLLLDVDGNDQVLIAVGERGHILVSRNHRASWDQAAVPTRSNLTAVDVVDEHHAWAVGHDAVVVHTADGGTTWTRQHWDPDLEKPLFDIWMQDRRQGFAIGAYGLYLETDDGGATWNERVIDEEEPHLYLVDQAENGDLYLVGEFGSIFRSDNGGADWMRCESPYGGSFFGVLTVGAETLVFGLRGNIFRSGDDGESWERVDSGITTGLFAGARLQGGKILIAGQSGTLLVSSDQGRSFDVRSAGNRHAISAVFEQPDGSLLLVGEGGIQSIPALPAPEQSSADATAPKAMAREKDPAETHPRRGAALLSRVFPAPLGAQGAMLPRRTFGCALPSFRRGRRSSCLTAASSSRTRPVAVPCSRIPRPFHRHA